MTLNEAWEVCAEKATGPAMIVERLRKAFGDQLIVDPQGPVLFAMKLQKSQLTVDDEDTPEEVEHKIQFGFSTDFSSKMELNRKYVFALIGAEVQEGEEDEIDRSDGA